MAERIVSPGVFTRERDVSFLPQGVSEIGAAVIGPTVKGPAFVPTTLTSFSEFENTFGGRVKIRGAIDVGKSKTREQIMEEKVSEE